MTISFVGAGNVAYHLAPAFASAGHHIISIYSRKGSNAKQLAERVGQNSVFIDDLSLLSPADFYIICIKDDALEWVAENWPSHCCQGVILHTSGTVSIEVLSTIKSAYGVLYPLQTFSKNSHLDISKITCFVEGVDNNTLSQTKEFAASVFKNIVSLSSDKRKYLHLASVFACNFSNHMYDLAYEILEENDINPKCLIPLINETTKKLRCLHPRDGQTGPARRGDISVVKKQTEALSKKREIQKIYKIISQSILTRFHK